MRHLRSWRLEEWDNHEDCPALYFLVFEHGTNARFQRTCAFMSAWAEVAKQTCEVPLFRWVTYACTLCVVNKTWIARALVEGNHGKTVQAGRRCFHFTKMVNTITLWGFFKIYFCPLLTITIARRTLASVNPRRWDTIPSSWGIFAKFDLNTSWMWQTLFNPA